MGKIIRNRYVGIALPLLLLVAVVIAFTALTGGKFISYNNLSAIFEQSLIVAVSAIGIAFIYTTGNIDMSVGSIIMLSGVIAGKVWAATGSVVLLFLISFTAGAAMLYLNNVLSATLGLKTVMAAILMMNIYNAVGAEFLGAETISIYRSMKEISNSNIRLIIFAGLFLVCLVVFHFTKIGRALRFTGGNERCAATVGINNRKIISIGYIMASLAVGIACAFTLIRNGNISSVPSSMGSDLMLATVLGGMSIFGGHKSNCYSGVIGAFIVVILNNGLLMLGVSNTLIQGVRGILFLAIVYLTSDHPDTLPSRNQFS
ncbi:MAG TPA: ABC transporter permease [Clostridiales bacterium]|nr:ABC transporter permease [Clostridiales bacterium]